jgi:hypothetical protein
MRRFVTILTAVVAVAAFNTMAFAQATTAAKPAAATKPAAAAKPAVATTQAPAAKPAATAKSAKLSVKGEGKYDEATKELTVGDKVFTLAPEAKITMGAKAATTADLTGKHVMVTYTVVDGKNVASKVTIAAAKPAKVAAPKK